MLRMLIICILMIILCFTPALAVEESRGGLAFSVVEWAFEVRDESDYDPNPSGCFPRGERAYAYLELEGFDWLERDGLHLVQVSVDVALRTAWGLRLFKQADVLEFDSWYWERPESFWFYIYVDIPRWAPRGTYITEITVRDHVGGQILEEKREIEIF